MQGVGTIQERSLIVLHNTGYMVDCNNSEVFEYVKCLAGDAWSEKLINTTNSFIQFLEKNNYRVRKVGFYVQYITDDVVAPRGRAYYIVFFYDSVKKPLSFKYNGKYRKADAYEIDITVPQLSRRQVLEYFVYSDGGIEFY